MLVGKIGESDYPTSSRVNLVCVPIVLVSWVMPTTLVSVLKSILQMIIFSGNIFTNTDRCNIFYQLSGHRLAQLLLI